VFSDGHVNGYGNPLLLGVELQVEAARQVIPAITTKGYLEAIKPPAPAVGEDIDASEGGMIKSKGMESGNDLVNGG